MSEPVSDVELDAIERRNEEAESPEEFAGWACYAIRRLAAEVRRLQVAAALGGSK